jgi:hypothetical protein
MLLSIALGFDLITREKEEGSLKSLLSHPVYRDSVINGKLIGALSILVIVMGSVFLVTLSIMLFYGVVPNSDDLLRIAAYFVMALLYCGVFFAIATLFSTLAKTSAMSILFVLGVVVALIIVPTFAPKVADAIMGPAPQVMPFPIDNVRIMENGSSGKPELSPISSKIIDWNPEVEQYYQKRQMIIDSIDTVSPMYSFDYRLSPAIHQLGLVALHLGQVQPLREADGDAQPYVRAFQELLRPGGLKCLGDHALHPVLAGDGDPLDQILVGLAGQQDGVVDHLGQLVYGEHGSPLSHAQVRINSLALATPPVAVGE